MANEKEQGAPKLVEVVAVEAGHDGITFRHAGERFKVDEGRLKDGSTWFVRPGDEPEPAAKPSSKRPPGAGPVRGSGSDPAAV